MIEDLKQYRGMIEQLKPMIAQPGFNQALESVASELSKDKRFLLKMELKRLAKPCIRVIDMRDQVSHSCEYYNHEGIGHYLDKRRITLFEEQLSIFGRYSFGVYEAILEDVQNKSSSQRQASEDDSGETELDNQEKARQRYSAPAVNLLHFAQRQHERMNYVVMVEIFDKQNASMHGISQDISEDGLRIKASSDLILKPADIVSVYFRGDSAGLALKSREPVLYKVIDSSFEEEDQFIRLQRDDEHPNPVFDEFLHKFIQGNKRRYKVNLQNTIDAIINKTCEQYFSPRYPSLPVFIDEVDGKLTPRFAMSNIANKDILDYWSTEEDDLKLGYLLSEQRLKLLCDQEQPDSLIVFAFNHIKEGKIYFYSASDQELSHNSTLRNLFIGFGARKISWRVFKLRSMAVSSDDAFVPLSIPAITDKKLRDKSKPPPPRLMAKLKDVHHIIHVTDITSDIGQQTYAKRTFSRSMIKNLRNFAHPRNRQVAEVEPFRFKSEESRVETRYILRSPVEVSIDGEIITGITEDISVHGLRIELDERYDGEPETRVSIHFPELQNLSNQHDVTALPYRIIHISAEETVLHLRVISGFEGRPAIEFFRELIKHNQELLETYPQQEKFPGMGHALRCITAKNVAVTSFVVQKNTNRVFPYACITPDFSTPINKLATFGQSDHQLNFEFLFRDRSSKESFIDSAFKQVRMQKRLFGHELLVMLDETQEEPNDAIKSRWSDKFASDKSRFDFVQQALKHGHFIAIKVFLTNTDAPDMSMLEDEISYVSGYAIHRARELEESLWNISGCIHLFDITDEMLTRYQFDSHLIQANHLIKPTSNPS